MALRSPVQPPADVGRVHTSAVRGVHLVRMRVQHHVALRVVSRRCPVVLAARSAADPLELPASPACPAGEKRRPAARLAPAGLSSFLFSAFSSFPPKLKSLTAHPQTSGLFQVISRTPHGPFARWRNPVRLRADLPPLPSRAMAPLMVPTRPWSRRAPTTPSRTSTRPPLRRM